jgi:hypothetical protein
VLSSYLAVAVQIQFTLPPRTRNVSARSKPAHVLHSLLTEYSEVDFSPLRGFQPDWDAEPGIDAVRVHMITACFLHFDCCAATVVRYMGGPHTAAHRDPDALLAALRPSVDPTVLSDLECILGNGTPAYINAHSTEKNFQAYRTFGNHCTVSDIPEEEVRNTLAKSFIRGYVLVMNEKLLDYIPHMHLTPQGIIDLDHPYKNP